MREINKGEMRIFSRMEEGLGVVRTRVEGGEETDGITDEVKIISGDGVLVKMIMARECRRQRHKGDRGTELMDRKT